MVLTESSNWSDKHYSFEYHLYQRDSEVGSIRVDPYLSHYAVAEETKKQETPWYPDDSGEWVEVDCDVITSNGIPEGLHLQDTIEGMLQSERKYKSYNRGVFLVKDAYFSACPTEDHRVVAYRVVKKHKLAFEDGNNFSEHADAFSNVCNVTTKPNEWTDKHYSFEYALTKQDKNGGTIKVDPYFVSKQWQLGKKDDTGTIFHILKTIARFGDKNSKEREIKALYAQVKRLAELEGVDLN